MCEICHMPPSRGPTLFPACPSSAALASLHHSIVIGRVASRAPRDALRRTGPACACVRFATCRRARLQSFLLVPSRCFSLATAPFHSYSFTLAGHAPDSWSARFHAQPSRLSSFSYSSSHSFAVRVCAQRVSSFRFLFLLHCLADGWLQCGGHSSAQAPPSLYLSRDVSGTRALLPMHW